MFWDREKYIENNPYFTEKNCPFCIIKEEEKKLILYESKHWQIRYNKFPYYWYKQNLLAFPKKHKIYTTDLTLDELKDFKQIEIFLQNYFWKNNYFSFIRQWIWWRSIEHLHYHYLQWEIYHSNNEKNTFKIKNIN
jgi:diadenosine tetraphosphate (Ap4A) HIT family hydrolase